MRHTASWIAALMLGVLLTGASGGAQAQTAAAAAILSDSEQAMLEENPLLAELAVTSPELLRDVFDRIAEALARPSGTRGGLGQLEEDTVRLFGQNPALFQVWRSSPEASADLLQLIRTAAGGGKPRQ